MRTVPLRQAFGVVLLLAARVQAQDLLPGEMRVDFGRELVEPKEFPTLRELVERIGKPEQGPAIVFRFYGDQHNHYAPQWSHDGRALAVLRSDIEAHTSKIVMLPGLAADQPMVLYADSASYDHMFAWSSSGGRTFAFASTNEPSEMENVHVAALAGEPRPQRVTSGPGVKSNPALWTDGTEAQLFFSLAGKLQSRRINLEQPAPDDRGQPLGDGTEAVWSPDGKWLAWTERIQLSANQSNYALKIRDRARQLDQRLFGLPGMLVRSPAWSPDGGHLAFYARPVLSTSWRLYVAPAPAGVGFQQGDEPPAGGEVAGGGVGRAKLVAQDVRVEEHFQNFGPSWDPRGDRLWFFAKADDQEYYPLHWATLDGGRRGQVGYPRRLTTGLDVAVNPDPKLRAIAFCAIEDLRQDVIVMILAHEPEK